MIRTFYGRFKEVSFFIHTAFPTDHSRNRRNVPFWVEHEALCSEVTLQSLLEVGCCAVDALVLQGIPVVRVPSDDEPYILGTIEFLLVNLQHPETENTLNVEQDFPGWSFIR